MKTVRSLMSATSISFDHVGNKTVRLLPVTTDHWPNDDTEVNWFYEATPGGEVTFRTTAGADDLRVLCADTVAEILGQEARTAAMDPVDFKVGGSYYMDFELVEGAVDVNRPELAAPGAHAVVRCSAVESHGGSQKDVKFTGWSRLKGHLSITNPEAADWFEVDAWYAVCFTPR